MIGAAGFNKEIEKRVQHWKRVVVDVYHQQKEHEGKKKVDLETLIGYPPIEINREEERSIKIQKTTGSNVHFVEKLKLFMKGMDDEFQKESKRFKQNQKQDHDNQDNYNLQITHLRCYSILNS